MFAVELLIAGCLLCATGSASDGSTDAERHFSSQMNQSSVEFRENVAGGVKVAFLGNSITLHGVAPGIGWTNAWGMAASAAEKDYVHIVTRGIEKATGRKADVLVRNLAAFERGFEDWDVGKGLDDVVSFSPDYLIVALGENVRNLKVEKDKLAFRKAFKGLLTPFFRGKTRPNVVVRGVFWPNADKDFQMAHVASDFAVPFVRADLATASGMQAKGLFQHPGVAAHPGDEGMAEIARRVLAALFPEDAGYAVWIDGAPVRVRPIRISAMPFNQWAAGYQRPWDQTEVAGMVALESDDGCEVRVRPSRKFEKAVLRPLAANVKPSMTHEGELVFRLGKCGHYVLELDGYHSPLQIFVEPKTDFLKKFGPPTLAFGPGLHEPVVVKVRDHDRIYIHKDAVVRGSFQLDGVDDVKIYGYGIIDGARNRRDGNDCGREGQATPIRMCDSRNVTIEGPIVTDSPCWCVDAFNCENVSIAHLKIAGQWRYNTDGIDICNSRHVRIRDSFVHSFDDSIVLKGLRCDRDKGVEDVLVERCVCWCGWGRTLEIGYETWAPRYRAIRFRDCDLIHNNGGALSVHMGGDAQIEDIAFRNIRIEYDASEMSSVLQKSRDQRYDGTSPWAGAAITVTNDKMFKSGGLYGDKDGSARERFGNFQSLVFEDIDIRVGDGAKEPSCVIKSEPGTAFGKIAAKNVRINGQDVTHRWFDGQGVDSVTYDATGFNTVPGENQIRSGRYVRFEGEGMTGGLLCVGSSFAWHGPAPDTLGWSGDWGMAASAREKDCVHQVWKAVREKNPRAPLCIVQSAYWERNYTGDVELLERNYGEVKEFRPDWIVIITTAGNAPKSLAEAAPLKEHYAKMVDWFRSLNPNARVVLSTHYRIFAEDIGSYARTQGLPLVDFGEFLEKPGMRAWGQFKDKGVAGHPSDLGFAEMAKRYIRALGLHEGD